MKVYTISPSGNKKPENIEIKMNILGFERTGKTLFAKKLTSKNNKDINHSLTKYIPTIGGEYRQEIIIYEKKSFLVHIWDTAGQERFFSLLNVYLHQTNIILIFYDPLNRYSFDKIKDYLVLIKNRIPFIEKIVIAIVRNKYELNIDKNNSENIVSDEEALEYADKNNVLFFHLSNFEKYETGINELINSILKNYILKLQK